MEMVDRRMILAGSGLALALASCSKAKSPSKEKTVAPQEDAFKGAGILDLDPIWNIGDRPWRPNPNPRPSFDPAHTALLYININESPRSIDFLRVHFPAVKSASGANGWAENRALVLEWINFLNKQPMAALLRSSSTKAAPLHSLAPLALGGSEFPNAPGASHVYYTGIRKFAFNSAHHFVIYVRNEGSSFHPDYPIMFTRLLRNGMSLADENYSFYNKPPIGVTRSEIPGNFSNQLLYCENHYYTKEAGAYRPIQKDEIKVHALWINTVAEDNDGSPITLPIDPDTGNMGEGQPV